MIEEKPAPRKYRILALDGGGIRGAFSASFLHNLEVLSGQEVAKHFDLISGTSTGGIIAIAIGLGIPLKEIVDLYVNKGPTIFPCGDHGVLSQTYDWLRHLCRPKHLQSTLQAAMRDTLGERCFGESNNRLVIPAFNAVNGEIQLFKTAHCDSYRMDYKLPAMTVALATSAAPTYFDAYTDPDGRVFIDGGVWANCPLLVALVEATACLDWPMHEIDVLSVGTISEPLDVSRRRRRGGVVRWGKGLIDLLMAAQDRGTLGLANAMTKHRVRRIDIIARPGRFSLDNSREVTELRALGENMARRVVDEIRSRFLTTPAIPFVPCHGRESAVHVHDKRHSSQASA